jgi:hypothetical protein
MTNQQKLGKLGESIVIHHFGGFLSEDMYDMHKDLTLPNGDNVEVKTQNRYRTENAFTVPLPYKGKHTNQIVKCLKVERLFFVEYTIPKSDIIRVWECTNRNYRTIFTRHGQKAAFDIDQMTLLEEFHNSQVSDEMYRLSQAEK